MISLLLLISCSDKEDPIGKWDDIIKLSTKDVDFTAAADSISITTEGDWWWIDRIIFEDSTYNYYQREDIDLEAESYSLKENSFLVEKRDNQTLFVKINRNTTGEERFMVITLEAGNYFDYVHIQQAAD